MAIIKKYGKPDLFITFTCNPKWRELTGNFYPGQNANDRSDLVTRLFKLKLNNLYNDIFKHGVLDKVVTQVQVIEYQNRAVHNGYPRYRGRYDGLVIDIKVNNVDDRWVIPYNPWLSKKYQAHINVEACMSVKAVKYLYKCIYKGHDCANVLINEQFNHNEVNTFLGCCYVSAPEALWRIFEHPINHMSNTIIRLKVNLPENQTVYFREG
ncbi:uncharacterized protein LOC136089645 [Hydra vulgaris]|uniref:Uncharacterized protein LOC136089645 n=1 Tax=Hydra vulgaris TaxID=6087 RepID=A0ABM4DBM5_HYDVU